LKIINLPSTRAFAILKYLKRGERGQHLGMDVRTKYWFGEAVGLNLASATNIPVTALTIAVLTKARKW
jgi:hypothetical protein